MSVEGVRVLRGPDWRGRDTDGGEGYVGTVIQLLGNYRVRVLWDMGQESTCSTGADGKFDLRVFDTAQIGIRHLQTRCADCGENDIFGMLWRCQDCAGYDLCPMCYSDDKHELRHQFLRIDTPGSKGYPVPKRKTSVRTRAIGMFPGSKVTRGKDWQWDDQDGGQGSEGEVIGYENVSPDSSRNLVNVRWPHGPTNSYRHGFFGYVDLMCVEEEVGPYYYRDHLPVLDTEQLATLYKAVNSDADTLNTAVSGNENTTEILAVTESASTTDADSDTDRVKDIKDDPKTASMQKSNLKTGKPDSVTSADTATTHGGAVPVHEQEEASKKGREGRETTLSADGTSLVAGSKVAVCLGVEKLLQLQRQCGENMDGMKRIFGQTGEVTELIDGKGIAVKFKSCNATLNPAALVTVQEFEEGDKVRIREVVEEVRTLNSRIGWKTEMEKTVGKVGQVLKVDSDGDLLISFGRHHFIFVPAACTHVTSGTSVDSLELDAISTGKSDSGEKATSVTENPKQLFEKLREAVIKERTEPSLFSFPSDPGVLFSAVLHGESDTVRRICTADKSMIEYEHERLTPLLLACAKGHGEVVFVLLELGANVNHCVQPRSSPVGAAIEGKHEDIALVLLEKGADPFYLDDRGHTHIHIAAYHNLPRVIKALAARGVDVNAKDAAGDAAIHVAIFRFSNEAVAALMDVSGIDLTVTNQNDFPVMHHCCSKGNARALEMMLEKDKSQVQALLHGVTPLHLAANDDFDECVRILVLNGGAEVNFKDKGGPAYTPLHLACIRAMFRSAKALLELGADMQIQDRNGHTPLHLAIGGRRIKDSKSPEGQQENQLRVALANMLISNGAYVDAEDFSGRDPLTYGVSAVRKGVMQFMEHNKELVKRKGGTAKSGFSFGEPEKVSESLVALSLQDQGGGPLKEALKGVVLPCGVCNTAKSDVTLQPCGHKCVCSGCSDKVTKCPLCDEEVKDKIVTGADGQTLDPGACKQM